VRVLAVERLVEAGGGLCGSRAPLALRRRTFEFVRPQARRARVAIVES